MSKSEASVAVLFMTHFINGEIISEYRRLKSEVPVGHEVTLLLNTSEKIHMNVPEDIHAFRFNELNIRRLRYPRKSCDIAPANIELFVLNYWLAHPHHTTYWVIENDVRFSGPWSLIFQAFRDSRADLLSTTIFRYPTNPDWANWPSLRPPSGVVLPPEERISSFLPFYRISQDGLRALHAGYRNGWAGHCECTVPTILARAGLNLEDIGGDGEFVAPVNRNRFYRNTPNTRTHGPGTLVFRPIRRLAGEEPNMLWHPVKAGTAMVTNRRQRALRRARILWRAGLQAVGL